MDGGNRRPGNWAKRQARAADTRAKLLAAGAALFARLGYEAATLRDLAAAAGMSTGAVFANFKDKAELYRAIHGHRPVTPELGAALVRLGAEILRDGVSPGARERLQGLVALAGGALPEVGE